MRLQAAFGLALPEIWASLQQTLEADGGDGGGGGEGGGGGGGAGGAGGARQLCLVATARLMSSASLGGRAPPSGQPAALLRTVGSLLRPSLRPPRAAAAGASECAVACAALDCISELAERQACRLHVHMHIHAHDMHVYVHVTCTCTACACVCACNMHMHMHMHMHM